MEEVQISRNLGIVTVEPDKDTQELYILYLKKLGITEDRIMLAESGKKYVEIFENKKREKMTMTMSLQS